MTVRQGMATEETVLNTHVNMADELSASSMASEQMLDFILNSLEDDKADDIVSIDLRGKSEMADYMVVASGRSSRRVSAICEKLALRLKQEAGLLCRMEGKQASDWVLMDCGDVIVHIFRPEVREFYQLEKMWLPEIRATRA